MGRFLIVVGVFLGGVALGYFGLRGEQPVPGDLEAEPAPRQERAPQVHEPAAPAPRPEPTRAPPKASAPASAPVPVEVPTLVPREAAPEPVEREGGKARILVKVVGVDGEPADEATVHHTDDVDAKLKSMRRIAWTPEQPHLELDTGTHWIVATSGPSQTLISNRVPVEITPTTSPAEIVLMLQERPGIHGRIVFPDDVELPHVHVSLLRYVGDTPPASPAFHRDLPRARIVTRDRTYAFHDLAPGNYLVALQHTHNRDLVVKGVRVVDRSVRQDLVFDRLDPQEFMEVRVVGPDGKPLSGVTLSTSFSGKGRSVAGGNMQLRFGGKPGVFVTDHAPQYTRDEDGTWHEGRFSLHVFTREHGRIVVPYDPRDGEPLEIRVGTLQNLVVRFPEYRLGRTDPSFSVGVRMVGESGVRDSQKIGRDGTIDFGRRPPGSYEVVLEAGTRQRWLVGVVPITFTESGDPVEVALPTFYSLLVHVPSGSDDPAFGLSRKRGRGISSIRGIVVGDRIEFGFLTEGTYTLSGHYGSTWVKREIVVTGDTEIRLH